MTVSVELPETQIAKLHDQAQRLGVRPEDLAAAAIADLLHREESDFASAADYVLRKNRELYRRLA
jgi:hypothetical protein